MASPRSIAIRTSELLAEISELVLDLGGEMPTPPRRNFRQPAMLALRQLESVRDGLKTVDRDGGIVQELALAFPPDEYPDLHGFLSKWQKRQRLGIRKPPKE